MICRENSTSAEKNKLLQIRGNDIRGVGGAENDGHENDGPSKCPGMKLTDMKMQDMLQVSE